MIDYTINIGIIIQIFVLVAGGFITIGGGLFVFKSMARDMKDMKAEIKKFGEVLITLAVTTKRLDNVEEDIRDMKHGRGFIRDRLNGEYP
jgi:hypothetical protein